MGKDVQLNTNPSTKKVNMVLKPAYQRVFCLVIFAVMKDRDVTKKSHKVKANPCLRMWKRHKISMLTVLSLWKIIIKPWNASTLDSKIFIARELYENAEE